MDEQSLLDELLDLADKIGFEIRREFLGGSGGGICKLRGKWVLFVDDQATRTDQLDKTAEALAPRPELQDCFIVPQIRELLDKYL